MYTDKREKRKEDVLVGRNAVFEALRAGRLVDSVLIAKGNSGGPVFNSLGQVIGIFTMSYKSAYASSSGAVPIKYGLELMR